MKLLSLLFCFFIFNCANTNTIDSESFTIASNQITSDYLEGIQGKIENSFNESIMKKDSLSLSDVKHKILEVRTDSNARIVDYWLAYHSFYYSIFYNSLGNKKLSEEKVKEGINILRDKTGKSSEELALLAMLQGFSIQFAQNGLTTSSLSKKIKRNAKKAIELDEENLRGYYVYGSNDFYTPEQYGGLQETEKYLLKAISLPDQKVENPYLPSWGKDSAYELLIKYYIKKDDWTNAKKYFKEAVEAYPDNYMINQLATQIATH